MSTHSQECPADLPQTDPQVLAFITQVAELQKKIATLNEIVATTASPDKVINRDG